MRPRDMQPEPGQQSGFSLVELLVVIVLLAVIGGVVVNAVVSSLRASTAAQARIAATAELETALQRITRDIRFGSVSADPAAFETLLITEFQRGGETRTIGYDASSGSLESIEFVEVDGTLTTLRRLLVTELDNTSHPVFTYLQRDGEEIPCEAGDDCAAAYRSAAQVRITLVRSIGDREPVIVASQVGIRNLRYRSVSS